MEWKQGTLIWKNHRIHYIRQKNEKTIYFLYEDFFKLQPEIASRQTKCIAIQGEEYLMLKEILSFMNKKEMESILSCVAERLFSDGAIVIRDLLLENMDLLMRVNRLLISINESFITSRKGKDYE